MTRKMFHTQEFRGEHISTPIPCTRDDAWLGSGAYFWLDVQDAIAWGKSSKRTTGQYAVYQADIDCEQVLDTVFNEEHYVVWLKVVEDISQKFMDETGEKLPLKFLNDYLIEKIYPSLAILGVLFQDMPSSEKSTLVAPVVSGTGKPRLFIYRKRIQLVAYQNEIIRSFTPHLTGDC